MLVQPLTLVQLALAAGAAGAAAFDWLAHAGGGGGASLTLAWGAAGAVAARGSAIWGQVKAHQAELERTMASMQVG